MLHSLELDFIRFIHQFRNPAWDKFFELLDFFDTAKFFFLLIPIVWLIRGNRAGARLFYLLMLSNIVNHALKEFFLSPRPFHLDSGIEIMKVPGYGFPSGAAQTVILLLALLLKSWKSKWKWVITFSYIFLVSLSRVYLGLHFPSDIFAGWLVGLILWSLFVYTHQWIEKMQPEILFIISQAIIIPSLILQVFTPPIYICSTGIATGLLISHHYKISLFPPIGYKEWILRLAVGVFGVGLCFQWSILISVAYSKTHFFLGTYFLGLWVSLIAPFICKTFSKQKECAKE